jgi:hypothetical protein
MYRLTADGAAAAHLALAELSAQLQPHPQAAPRPEPGLA